MSRQPDATRESKVTGPGPSGDANFHPHKTLEPLAAKQGVSAVPRFDELLGSGASLWNSDADFEEFLAGINSRRRTEP